jgi:hypothetical protein
MTNERNALSDLLIATGRDLFIATQAHTFTCVCEDCQNCRAIWAALRLDDRSELLRSLPDLFNPDYKPEEPTPAEDELLRAAIDSVIAREDDEAWPDVSHQVVALVMTDPDFEPLRERIFRSLFDA